MNDTDTIAAIATPPGRGGVGIVRVSGPAAADIADAVVGGRPRPRRAALRGFADAQGAPLDEGIVLWMPGPDTFTGEDVLELHGHGGAVVMDLILQRTLELGARPARPGEFAQRAYLNDRMDLAQAEAIADLIDSGSAQAARAAARSLRGELSARVHDLQAALTELRVYTEAAIDFPEEEIDFLADAELGERLGALRRSFDELQHAAGQGALLREGMTVVIAGAPNAGKSSLLNRLAGYEAAIVTDIPGTTRDLLRERIDLDGLPLHVVDTAGLRESEDRVEREGVRRAQAEIAAADRVLLVVDAVTGELPSAPLPPHVPVTVVRNKIDLLDAGQSCADAPTKIDLLDASQASAVAPDKIDPLDAGQSSADARARRAAPAANGDIDSDSQLPPSAESAAAGAGASTVCVSAKTGAGLDELRRHLQQCMGYEAGEATTIMARRRHLDALARARAHVEQGAVQLEKSRAGELLAEELRLAQRALGEITGEFSSDDLLGEIFGSFCIGK